MLPMCCTPQHLRRVREVTERKSHGKQWKRWSNINDYLIHFINIKEVWERFCFRMSSCHALLFESFKVCPSYMIIFSKLWPSFRYSLVISIKLTRILTCFVDPRKEFLSCGSRFGCQYWSGSIRVRTRLKLRFRAPLVVQDFLNQHYCCKNQLAGLSIWSPSERVKKTGDSSQRQPSSLDRMDFFQIKYLPPTSSPTNLNSCKQPAIPWETYQS